MRRDWLFFIREVNMFAKLAHPAIFRMVGHVMPNKVSGRSADHFANLDAEPLQVIGIELAMRYMHASPQTRESIVGPSDRSGLRT
jgi:hypothetical protein